MQLTEDNRVCIQDWVNKGLLTPQVLNSVTPSLITCMPEMIKELSPKIDRDTFLTYALLQSERFVYFPNQEPDIAWIKKAIPAESVLECMNTHLAIPLKQTAHTLWVGLCRPYPFRDADISRLLNPNDSYTMGWAILTPAEFSEATAKILTPNT